MEGEAATPDDAFGRKILAVCVEGASIGARDTIERAVHLAVGAALTESTLRGALEDVHRTGVADDVAAYGRKLGAGVVVILRIRERPRVGKVTVEGAKLANITVEQAPRATPLHPGEYFDPAYAHNRAEALRAGYAEGGFDDAKVTPKTTPGGEGLVDVHMVIEEGKRSQIGKVAFVGITRSLEADVAKASGLERGQPASSTASEGAPERITAYYLERGYVTANVRVDRGVRDADGSVPFTFTVTEGPVFRVGKLTLTKTGFDAAETRELLTHLKTQNGAIFRRSSVVADIAFLQQAYATRGRKVEVRAKTDIDATKKTINLELEIEDAT